MDELRLDPDHCRAMCGAARIVNTVEESKRLNQLRWPSIIVSASGMATGGRVVHHLKAFAPDRRNTILFAGFQAAGTRGAALLAGAKTIKIHGEHIPVRAEVASIDSLSAHADRDGLLEWIGALPSAPRQVFVTHGEPVAADSLRQAIEERHRWPCCVPEYGQVVELALIPGPHHAHFKLHTTAIALLSCALTLGPVAAAETRGELLYSLHCITCHTVQIHWRDEKLATDWLSLRYQVRRWESAAQLGWSEADILDVTRYLNESVYRFSPSQEPLGELLPRQVPSRSGIVQAR